MGNVAHTFRPAEEGAVASPYARMILGKQSAPVPALTSVLSRQPASDPKAERAIVVHPPQESRKGQWLRYVLPQPIAADRFVLYQRVITDQIILLAACMLPSLAYREWGLPFDAVATYLVLVTLFGFSEGLYQSAASAKLGDILPALTKSLALGMSVVFIAARDDAAAVAFPITFFTTLIAFILWRSLLLRGRRKSHSESRNVLIVGAGPAGRAIARTLHNDPSQATVRGFVDDYAPLSADVLGRVEDLEWLARGEFIDEVIVALPNQLAQAREAAHVALRNHLDVRAVPDLPAGVWPEASVDRIGDVPVVTLHREPVPSAALFAKRLLDTAGALVGLVLAAPVMAAVALMIRLDSPGPVFYAAERTGARGRRFRCYKFRSMTTDADRRKDSLRARNQREGPIFKIDDDPRITRVGRFIRRYSLDELPQLWNVLRGDMSMVGPRPHPVDEVSHYELHHYRRLDVKPGVTGLWQVTARKNPSFDLNMHLDLTYIENWTLFLDLRILMRTVRVLFAAEGA